MRIKKTIGNVDIVANCTEAQQRQAMSLLDKLSELNEKGPALKDGSIIRFGWSDLKLVSKDNELVVMEPDFRNNPFRDFLPQVNETLAVLTVQTQLLNKANVAGIDSLYNSKVIIDKGCLADQEVYLERSHPTDEQDSGWFIGKMKNIDKERTTDNLQAVYVFQVFQQRPPLLDVMAFPPGYLAVYQGDELRTVVDEHNNNVLLRK